MNGILGAYLVVVFGVAVWNRTWITPDLLLGFAALVALALRRGPAFLRDWIPFVAIFLAWEAAHGLTSDPAFAVHSDGVIALERLVSLGVVPAVELQALLHDPSRVSPLDIATSAVYAAHFILPFATAFWFWFNERSTFLWFATALLGMSVAQFTFAILVPVAPPRFAGVYGAEDLAVVDVAATVATEHGLTMVSWAYQNMVGNPVAAFPSLHVAYPALAALFLQRKSRALALLMWGWTALVCFAIVYLGHHYVVDAIGGLVLAAGTYWVAAWFMRRRRAR